MRKISRSKAAATRIARLPHHQPSREARPAFLRALQEHLTVFVILRLRALAESCVIRAVIVSRFI